MDGSERERGGVVAAKGDGPKMERVAEGIYRRNGVYIVPIWNPKKGSAGGKDWHTLGSCACGRMHEGSTLSDARALKRALEAEKQNGKHAAAGKTVDEWAGHYEVDAGERRWVKGQWLELVPRLAESTNLNHDERVRPFARDFAGRRLTSITEEEAAGWALEHPGSFKEVRAMMNDAARLKMIPANPFAGIQMARGDGRRNITVLTGAELETLCGLALAIHGSYGEMYAAMIRTAAWTGLRPGELFLLSREPHDKMNHVDLRAGVVHVDWQTSQKTGKVTRPKNGTPREVVLLPAASDAVRSVKSWEAGKPLFVTKRGTPFTQVKNFYYWDPVRKAFVVSLPPGHHLRQREGPGGEVGNLDFYELRHFFGTKLAHPPAGVTPASPYEIAAMMGHVDGGQLAMERYVHVRSEDAQRSIRASWKNAS